MSLRRTLASSNKHCQWSEEFCWCDRWRFHPLGLHAARSAISDRQKAERDLRPSYKARAGSSHGFVRNQKQHLSRRSGFAAHLCQSPTVGFSTSSWSSKDSCLSPANVRRTSQARFCRRNRNGRKKYRDDCQPCCSCGKTSRQNRKCPRWNEHGSKSQSRCPIGAKENLHLRLYISCRHFRL